MYNINLTHVKVTDLNGQPVNGAEDLAKEIGNSIFVNAPSIELSDVARTLHAGKTAIVNEDQLNQIIEIVKHRQVYVPFVMAIIVEYLNSQKLIKKNKKAITEDK